MRELAVQECKAERSAEIWGICEICGSALLFQRQEVDDSHDGHVDWCMVTLYRCHGAPALGDHQNAVPHPGIHRVECQHAVAAIGAVEVQGLDHQNLPAFVARSLFRRDNIAHYSPNNHDDARGVTNRE